jgi:hypothetical protein
MTMKSLLRPEAQLGSFLELKLIRNAEDLVAGLLDFNLDDETALRPLIEASVRLPSRGHRWIAVFTGVQPDTQVWRSTGLTDYDAALALAKKWEAQAKAERRSSPRMSGPRGRRDLGGLTQKEVALLLRMSERAVRQIEKRALAKLRRHPLLRQLWRDHQQADLEEAHFELTHAEMAALQALAHRLGEPQLFRCLAQRLNLDL